MDMHVSFIQPAGYNRSILRAAHTHKSLYTLEVDAVVLQLMEQINHSLS